MRLGLAGLGVHGARYAEHLLRGDVPGATLAAVCRADVARGRAFAVEHGLTAVETPAELATHPAVDAVVLALPPDLHAPAAEACVRNGRPVLVEKPLAADAFRARALVELVEATGAFLMVAQTLRFDAVVEALRAEIASLGPLRMIYLNQRFEPATRSWIDTPGRGGMLLNTGVHCFDLLRHLTGLEATHIAVEARSALTRDTEDLFTAMLRLEPGGVLALVDNTRATHSRSGRIELVGERGQIWGDHIHRTLERVRGSERETLGPVAARHTVPATLASFVSAVREGRPPAVTAGDGAAAVELVDAALHAVRTGGFVALADLRRGL